MTTKLYDLIRQDISKGEAMRAPLPVIAEYLSLHIDAVRRIEREAVGGTSLCYIFIGRGPMNGRRYIVRLADDHGSIKGRSALLLAVFLATYWEEGDGANLQRSFAKRRRSSRAFRPRTWRKKTLRGSRARKRRRTSTSTTTRSFPASRRHRPAPESSNGESGVRASLDPPALSLDRGDDYGKKDRKAA